MGSAFDVVQGGGEEILAASTEERRSSICPSGIHGSDVSRKLSPKRIKKKKKSNSPYKSGTLKNSRLSPVKVKQRDSDVVMVVDMFSRSSESIHRRNLSN